MNYPNAECFRSRFWVLIYFAQRDEARKMLSKSEKLLVMVICDLLGKSVDPSEVEDAYRRAAQRMEQLAGPAPEATFSRAPRSR